ncbi:CapA family protein [Xenophilus arseniciresistens]|uniref:CapA family protein n=1 Tax=Xenophilus arseniciresistens TaxID=1283306 RepID=A0AAE3SYH4_9BURK|nr:CapA family protein [Xenophilus arseniciresistens]MDA7414831.1 CapA family protein [Xenophilus arseniciresistens]
MKDSTPPAPPSSPSAPTPELAAQALLARLEPLARAQLAALSPAGLETTPPCVLFLSLGHGGARAQVLCVTAPGFDAAWATAQARLQGAAAALSAPPVWLRIDRVAQVRAMTWAELQALLGQVKRNYLRSGIAFDAGFEHALLEQELGANAILYDNAHQASTPNAANLRAYSRLRFGRELQWPQSADAPVWLFDTRAVFSDGEAEHVIEHEGRQSGYRQLPHWGPRGVREVISRSADYLGRQVQASGQYHYGWFPCFDRPIPTYNTLRHASSTYSLLEAWELTRDAAQGEAIERALHWLATQAIRPLALPDGDTAAFLVDVGDEIKLGGNAVCLLAFSKHAQLTGRSDYLPLLAQLARGVLHMQNPETGAFVHVLNYPQLSVKQAQRIIYYDGEAAFGLMRLYGLTRDARHLAAVEKAFDHFIVAEHWRAHDHWLSYCVNELTLYSPQARYYRFGLDNVRGHLDFVLGRITTFPTLLELMCAAERMIVRLRADSTHAPLLEGFDLDKFHRALEYRARYLLSGHFWPELAMFFKNPARIEGSFFIRHHSWRVRIDDVEHYLSGLIAYLQYREGPARAPDAPRKGPVVLWGGDVNLGRRQHHIAERLGLARVLAPVRAIGRANLSIVNLECVVATGGERGVAKGEGGPYYFRARPAMLEVLAHAGVQMVSTANNHSGDYGPEAVREHLQWLQRAGIAQAGSGLTTQQALEPAFAAAGPLTVALFAIDSTQPRFAAGPDTPGCAHLPLQDLAAWTETLAPRIASARARADVVLVAVHWGDNQATQPSPAQVALGRVLIEAGADAVLGASAHRLQGLDTHQGRPILYDAGDLLFDARRHDGGRGGVFELEISANGVERVVLVPVQVGRGQSVELAGAARSAAARRYAELCADMGTPLVLRSDGTAALELAPPARAPHPQRARAAALPAPPPFDLNAIRAPLPMPADAQVDEVPADARLAQPLRLGPLRLLGIRVEPAAPLTQRRSPWVRSYWDCDAPVPQDLRLDIRAMPLGSEPREPWGLGMDHDPCDWLWPTHRWQPGRIVQDFCPLRPPPLGAIRNGRLQLQVALVQGLERVFAHDLERFIEVAIPGQPQMQEVGVPAPAPPDVPSYRTDFDADLLRSVPGQTWDAAQLAGITGGQWLVAPPPGWFVRSVALGANHVAMRDAPVLFVGNDNKQRDHHEQNTRPRARLQDRHELLPGLQPHIAGAIVSRRVPGLSPTLPVLQVPDPIQAVIELGLAARARYRGELIAITGTVGKSTTLGMLVQALGGPQRVLSSIDNYNSRVGAPATLASLSPEHEAAVIEVAQSALWMKRGPITRQLRPTIAVITAIAHSQTQQQVRSTEDVARWKSRVFDGLEGAAVAVFGEHLPHLDSVRAQARQHARRSIVYGRSASCEVRLTDLQADADGSWVQVQIGAQSIRFRVPLPGEGMVHNALAVAAVLHALGRDVQAGLAQLGTLPPALGRLQWHRLAWGQRQADVLDDSWNAEIASMVHAFGVLALKPSRRRWAALGRIVHLGEMAPELHRSLAAPLLAHGIEQVLTHGQEMLHLREQLPAERLGPHFESAEAMAHYLHTHLQDGDALLIKGSRRDSDFGEVFALLQRLCNGAQSMHEHPQPTA